MFDDSQLQGPAQTLAPAAHTASADGTSVDLKGFSSATVLIDVGVWTDGVHTFEVEHAPDDGTGAAGTFAAVADADLIGAEPVVDGAADDDQIYKIGYHGDKRWLRVAVTVSGETDGAVYGVSVVRGRPAAAPVA